MSNLIKGETGDWEVVIGLEVHCQVISKSKLFSGGSADFGGEAVTSQGYSTTPSQQTMAADAVVINPASIQIGNTGGSQSVNNMQPYLAVNFIIATQGLFPSRN